MSYIECGLFHNFKTGLAKTVLDYFDMFRVAGFKFNAQTASYNLCIGVITLVLYRKNVCAKVANHVTYF